MKTRTKLLLCFLYVALGSSAVYSQNSRVCKGCEIDTIATAISAATAGDTLIIEEGIYYEHEIIIDKPLTIIGKNRPTIDGDGEGSILRVFGDSVTIKGLNIRHVGFSHIEEFAAIHIQNATDFKILDNKLEAVFFGILIEKSKRGEISSNDIVGNSEREFYSGNGIHGWNSNELLITDNTVSGLRDGIYLEFVDRSKILRNKSTHNIRYGLHFMFANYDDYEENEFSENGAGVAVMFSKFINMKKNVFSKNWGTASFGLLLKEIYDAEIEGNLFEENTVGIQVEGSTRINYTKNKFYDNGWAVKISGGCFANIFSNNDFSTNSFDLSYNTKMNDNRFEGNYWSSYTGYDLDKDGIGDIPYRPVKLFSYIANRTPETIILLRSLFIDILNFSEKVSPVFTPDDLVDSRPKMKPNND